VQPGKIIWISGAPNSGKSSVSDKLAHLLTDGGHDVVRLDGDVLRAVLDETDIQDEKSRNHLLRIYLKLARLLSMQGLFVIVSAVGAVPAFFRELRDLGSEIEVVLLITNRESTESWNKRGVNVEKSLSIQESLLRMVDDKTIIKSNTMSTDLDTLAQSILEKIENSTISQSGDIVETEAILRALVGGRKSIESFWDSHYATSAAIPEESSFAKFCLGFFPDRNLIIYDVGCGDGRDSIFLGTKMTTIGVDISSEAINLARTRSQSCDSNVTFVKLESLSELSQVIQQDTFGVMYCRFLLHAIPKEEELHIWNLLDRETSVKMICIEARTTNDPLSDRGIRISRDEKVMGHYRRFIDPIELKRQVESFGFSLLQFSVSNNLSVQGADNPDLVRIVAIRD